jgi:hypothetical protein
LNKDPKLALLVMAAGLGSRYGGIKQIDGFGPNGETIMDYSLYDAIEAGFNKIVFIVREEIKETVKEIFEPKLSGKAEVHFVTQSIEKFVPEKFGKPNRSKPWGTTHAMLCGCEVINEPFAVINADDFYGAQAFRALAKFLSTAKPGNHCMVGYKLKDVLSENGTVSRGYAETDAQGNLLELTELTQIIRKNNEIISIESSGERILNPDAPVSMNCWGFLPEAFKIAEKMFEKFLDEHFSNPASEYYIALLVTGIIRQNLGSIHVIPGGNTWFGVTYKEDRPQVQKQIQRLVNEGQYPAQLWN